MNSKKTISSILAVALLTFASVAVLAAENELNSETASNESIIAETNDSLVVITGDNENIVNTNTSYDETTGLTDDEVLKLYNQYLLSTPNALSEETYFSAETLNGFAQYAVDKGIIEDTPVQRSAIKKDFLRGEFKMVAKAGNIAGYTTAAALLNHSLQDNPSNLSLNSSSTYSTQILNSSECRKIINDFITAVKGKNYFSRTASGSTTLNSTTDLHLAYNKVSYTASGRKTNGMWILTITFKDTYDFESQAWKNAMTEDSVITILNNYAAQAQSIGAIVPYNVQVTVQTFFFEQDKGTYK